jgi:hypothetical protein
MQKRAQTLTDAFIALGRDSHGHPELGFQERRTSAGSEPAGSVGHFRAHQHRKHRRGRHPRTEQPLRRRAGRYGRGTQTGGEPCPLPFAGSQGAALQPARWLCRLPVGRGPTRGRVLNGAALLAEAAIRYLQQASAP